MKKFINVLMVLSLTAIVFSSCEKEKDEHDHDHEEEVITTLKYTLTPATGDKVVLTFKDIDGDGGNAPTITGGTLAANTTYTGAITLANESETPAEDITEEVKEESDEHQFFFNSTVTNLSVSYKDKDGNNNPIGLSTEVKTGAAATGNLTVTLRHEPNKTATNVSNGDITNAGGSTDIEVVFPVEVK